MYLTGCLEQWSPDISTNPEEGKFDFAIVSNDKFCKKHGGNKHILKDSVRDSHGNYHDDIIYEIIND